MCVSVSISPGNLCIGLYISHLRSYQLCQGKNHQRVHCLRSLDGPEEKNTERNDGQVLFSGQYAKLNIPDCNQRHTDLTEVDSISFQYF